MRLQKLFSVYTRDREPERNSRRTWVGSRRASHARHREANDEGDCGDGPGRRNGRNDGPDPVCELTTPNRTETKGDGEPRLVLSVAAPSAFVGAASQIEVHGHCTCRGERSAEFLGESDEKLVRSADVAEPICVFVLNDSADDLRAAFAESFERLVDVVDGEHYAEVAERIHWGIPMIRDDTRPDKPRELQSTVAVRRAHHGNLDPLIS